MVILLGVPSEHPETLRMEARDRSNRPVTNCENYSLLTARSSVQVPTSNPRLAISVLEQIRERLVAFDLCGRRLRVNNSELALITAFLARLEEIAEDPAAETPETPSASGSGTEASIRQAIEERRAAVLACLEGEARALDVSWASGALTVSVAGADDSDPIHGCVRAALGSLEVPPGTGRVRHPVAP